MTESETAVWMRRMAPLSRSEGALPDPALIWWQAQLLERHETRQRAARPVAIAQWASAIVAAVTVTVLCALYWPGMRDALAPFAGFAMWTAVLAVATLMGLALRLVLSE